MDHPPDLGKTLELLASCLHGTSLLYLVKCRVQANDLPFSAPADSPCLQYGERYIASCCCKGVAEIGKGTFMRAVNLMEENVEVVWKAGLTLFSIAVLPRVYTTLRRNWLLKVKGPEINQEGVIPVISTTVSEDFIRGNDGYYDTQDIESLLLLVTTSLLHTLVSDEVESMKQAVQRSDSVYTLTGMPFAGKKSSIQNWKKSKIMISPRLLQGYDKRTKEELAIKTTYLQVAVLLISTSKSEQRQGLNKSSHLVQLEHELSTLQVKCIAGSSRLHLIAGSQRLAHPNIVKYRGANIIKDQLYLLMEYCQAG
eukprot:193478-Hanusia_phi.AAC.2